MGDAARGDADSPAAETVISAVLRGSDDATLTITGPLDAPAVARLSLVVKALGAAGVRYVVVDLAGLSACDVAARPMFAKLQRKLTLGEGWMLLLDPPSALAGLDPPSLEVAFAAYRRVVA